jgi:hypothetical protein
MAETKTEALDNVAEVSTDDVELNGAPAMQEPATSQTLEVCLAGIISRWLDSGH